MAGSYHAGQVTRAAAIHILYSPLLWWAMAGLCEQQNMVDLMGCVFKVK
jgi:hypothetical protein